MTYKLNKTAIIFKGEPETLLHGITSNTLDAPKNSFLDRFGRIIATFEQKSIDEGHLILIESNFFERLKEHLQKYLKLSKTTLHKTNYNMYYTETEHGLYELPQNNGRLIVTKEEHENTISEEEFTKFRLDSNWPLQGIDYDRDMVLNVSYDFVSFDKGCYLGQEIVARVHYKAKPPKKLVVRYEDEVDKPEKMSSMIGVDGREQGFVFVQN